MRFTNKRRKSKRKIRTRKYIKKGFKGGEAGEGTLDNFASTCLINPLNQVGEVLKKGYNHLHKLTKSGNENIASNLKTLSLQLSKMSPENKASFKKDIDKTLTKIEETEAKTNKAIKKAENTMENEVTSQIKKTPSRQVITVRDLNTKGGRKKRLRKSKKKKKRRKKEKKEKK